MQHVIYQGVSCVGVQHKRKNRGMLLDVGVLAASFSMGPRARAQKIGFWEAGPHPPYVWTVIQNIQFRRLNSITCFRKDLTLFYYIK
jgi:hypothetical protein